MRRLVKSDVLIRQVLFSVVHNRRVHTYNSSVKTFLKVLSLIVFVGLFLGTRIPRLGTDTVNSDEVLWHDRSLHFLNGIRTGKFKDTYQHYHPGVPLMWEFTLTAEILSRVKSVPISVIFNLSNYELLHINTQLFLTVWLLLLSILIIFYLSKALNSWWLSLFAISILSIEPYYLGNARIIHHDAQISLYVLLGITLVYLNVSRKLSFTQTVFAGLMLALATLTKTIFFGAFLFSFFAGSFICLLNQRWQKMFAYLLTLTLSFIFFYFLLFPAMWVQPRQTIVRIVTESFSVGEKEGHGQVFFGESTRNPGPFFYPILIYLKTSVFVLTGSLIFLIYILSDSLYKLRKRTLPVLSKIPFEILSAIFYIGYFSAITYFSKKVDRYLIPIYPIFALTCVLGWYYFLKKKIYLVVIPIALFVYSVAYPLYTIFPHYLMYTTPVFGDSKKSNEIIAQKLFGIGVFELRDKIVQRFGYKAAIAASDYGPLWSIYPNGKVSNVLDTHPNYFKIMVLGPNKPFPESLNNETEYYFHYIDSVYINGLEFWRIYKKEINKL